MKLDRNKMITLGEMPASFDAPTIYEIDSLPFEKGNSINDRSFVAGLAIKTFDPDMIGYGTIKWIAFCFCGMAVAELTGKYIVPPLDANLRLWKGNDRLPLLLWEQLWQASRDNDVFSQEDTDLMLRLFLPEASFTGLANKAYFSNRIGRSVSSIIPLGIDMARNAKADYERLPDGHKALIKRLLRHSEVMLSISLAAYRAAKEGVEINTPAQHIIEAV